jgi:hypothetical protein
MFFFEKIYSVTNINETSDISSLNPNEDIHSNDIGIVKLSEDL